MEVTTFLSDLSIRSFNCSGVKRRVALEWNCGVNEYFYDSFICGSNPSFCTYDDYVCDGVANCPNGDDEDFETCLKRGAFSEMATIKCDKKDVENVTIQIRAIYCDGVSECKNDEDETNCSLPEYVLTVTLVIIVFILIILCTFWWKISTYTLTKKVQIPTLPDIEILHRTETLKETMFQAQSLDNFQQINSAFIDVEMKLHNGTLSEIVCCIKVSK